MKEFNPFEKVLVRGLTRWFADFYSHKCGDKHYVVSGDGFTDDNIVPYEGNKYLLGTTDEPKPKRWRAEKDGEYYFVNIYAEVIESTDIRSNLDDDLYNAGNYFETKEEAEKVSEEVKKLLLSK